jgi:hypothetical protein
MKIGFGLLMLAIVLIGAAFTVLRAQGVANQSNMAGRMLESETREIGAGITAVELSGPIDLTLRYGAKPSLVIRGEQRLLGNIETTRDGKTLHIGPRGILLNHHHPLQAVLVLPALSSLSVDGSGDSVVDGMWGDRIVVQLDGSGSIKFNGRYRQVQAVVHGSGDLELDVGKSDRVGAEVVGSGDLVLAGSSAELQADVSGSGSIDARHLRADVVHLRQRGSGGSVVNARKSAAVTISGSGDVDVYGNPSSRTITRTGSGEVNFSD